MPGAGAAHGETTGTRYAKPWGQWIFNRPRKIKEVFDDHDLFGEESRAANFEFGSDNFSLKTIFDAYFTRVSL